MRNAINTVCHLDPKFGGISASVPPLVRATARTKRYNVSLIALCEPGERDDFEWVDGASLMRLPFRRLRPFADWALKRQIRDVVRAADVVHIHGIWRQHCLATGILATELEKPFVISAHGMLEAWALQNKRIKKAIYSALFEKRNLRRAQCLRALTRGEAEDYRRYGLRAPVVVVPNGVEIPCRLEAAPFWQRYPHLQGQRLILFLSRLHYKKGLDILCRAWATVSKRVSDAHLILAGPDCDHTQRPLENLIAELGIQHRVTFTGMLRGSLKWAALAAAHLFVLPSYSEGFSMATLEGLGTGKPVIISRQCYFPEVARHGCGWVIEPCAEQLETALLEFLRMRTGEITEMGANARRLVLSQYSWEVIGEQMADVYDWLLGGAKPGSVEIL